MGSPKLIATRNEYGRSALARAPTRGRRVLRPLLPGVAGEIIEAVAGVPAYAAPAGGRLRRGDARRGPGGAEPPAGRDRGGGAGRAAPTSTGARPGRDAGRAQPGSLLSAYRVGARVAWRRFAALGGAAGLEPDTLYLLAESIFAYIDVLSSESAEGYALEQSAAAGEARAARGGGCADAGARVAGRARRRRGRRPSMPTGRCRAAWPRWRSSATSARWLRPPPAAAGNDPGGDRRADLRAGGRSRRAGRSGRRSRAR